MPKAYCYCNIENFPEIDINDSLDTAGLFQFGDLENKPAHSKIQYLGCSDHENFEKFKIEHETERTLRHRVKKDIYNSVVELSEFHMYKHKKGYFFADTNKKELIEFVSRLNTSYQELLLLLKLKQVDLVSLRQDIDRMGKDTSITGGYFKHLKLDKVQAASIFGVDVAESNLWNEFENQGELGGLLFNFDFYNSPTSAMVTKSGSILTYNNFAESLALELVENINEIITPYSQDLPASIIRRKKKS